MCHRLGALGPGSGVQRRRRSWLLDSYDMTLCPIPAPGRFNESSPWCVGTRSARNGILGGSRSEHSAFYGAWKSGMIAGCTHTHACGTPPVFPASGPLIAYSERRRPPRISLDTRLNQFRFTWTAFSSLWECPAGAILGKTADNDRGHTQFRLGT